jgi:polysaccharide export outer membrane protein
MNLLRSTLILFCLVPALGAGFAQQGVGKPVLSAEPDTTRPAAAPPNPAVGPLTVSSSTYVIGADDSLKIDVWHEQQLSVVVPVRPDGKITLPLINDIQAAGFTPMQLEADITERLKKFVTDPVVSVSLEAVNSKRVFLIGEIGRPGPEPITPGMTILQAIAAAGGLGPYANKKKIYILRGDPSHQQKFLFNYKKGLNGDMQGLTLIPGDTIVVPE